MSRPLNHDWILRIHKAAIAAELAGSRDALLSGLDPALVSQLPEEDDPSGQILTDLSRLNIYAPSGEPLDNAPIAVWLKNAAQLREKLEECAVFQEALQHLSPAPVSKAPDSKPNQRHKTGHTQEDAPPPPRQSPQDSKPPNPNIILPKSEPRWKAHSKKLLAAMVSLALLVIVAIVMVLKGPIEGCGTCGEPPQFISGSQDYNFGKQLSDGEADQVKGKMKELLSKHKTHGPQWAAAISKSISMIGFSAEGNYKWEVYFKGVDSTTNICTWLQQCGWSTCEIRRGIKKSEPTEKTR